MGVYPRGPSKVEIFIISLMLIVSFVGTLLVELLYYGFIFIERAAQASIKFILTVTVLTGIIGIRLVNTVCRGFGLIERSAKFCVKILRKVRDFLAIDPNFLS